MATRAGIYTTITDRDPILANTRSLVFPVDIKRAIEIYSDSQNKITVRKPAIQRIENYLVEQGTCYKINPGISADNRLHIFQLDATILDKLLRGFDTFDVSLHSNISCMIDSILHDELGESGNLTNPNALATLSPARLHYWIKDFTNWCTIS